MPKIVAKVSGGNWGDYEADTVKGLRKALGIGSEYRATVGGDPQDDDYELADHETVVFAPAMKGGY